MLPLELRLLSPGARAHGSVYLHQLIINPKTWEDPNVIHPETKAKGDNDPLDVCEIGELVATPGQVKGSQSPGSYGAA